MSRCAAATPTWRCEAEAEPGKTRCVYHARANAQAQERHRQRALRAGRCKDCDKPAGTINRQYCERHRLLRARWKKLWRKRRSRLS